MENASKALIIAGAILISILLISAGIAIFNAIQPMQEAATGQGDTMAIDTFNAQFTSFEGTNLSASTVRSMFSKVQASNAENNAQVTVYKESEAEANKVTNTSFVESNKRYGITLEYAETGYIDAIIVDVP